MRTSLATGLVACLVTGCALVGPSEEPSVDGRVRVVPEIAGLRVTPSTIEIPRSAALEVAVGDIVVSAQGEGFLRTVDAIDRAVDAVVLRTSDAELGDALIDAELATSLGGAGKADTHQLPGIRFSIANRTLVDNAALTARIVDASLGFEPELDLDLAIQGRHLQNFEMVVRGRVSGSIDLDVVAREVEIGPEIRLWESTPIVFYQQIGPVPVVETVTTSVVLKLQVVARGEGRVRIDAGAIARVAGGLRYNPTTGWDAVADLDVDAHGSIPIATASLDKLGVRAWLAARVDVRFYGVGGPYIAAGPQLEVVRDVHDGSFDASAGFRGATGGGLRLFRLNLPALPSFELFDSLVPLH